MSKCGVKFRKLPVSQINQELRVVFQVVIGRGVRSAVSEFSEQIWQDRLVAQLRDTGLNQVRVQSTEMFVVGQGLHDHDTGTIRMVVLLNHET